MSLEEKRISYVIKDKKMDPAKLRQISELTNLNEKYAEVLTKLITKMKGDSNTVAVKEIEMRNNKETNVADILQNVRTKVIRAESKLREAVDSLV